MIYSARPLPTSSAMCREFGHMYLTLYDRPWKHLFRKRTWQVCVACDPEYRYEAFETLKDYIQPS